MVNALLNNSRVRQVIENEHQNCELLKLFKSYLDNPHELREVTVLKQVLHDYIVNYNRENPMHPYDQSIFFNNTDQQDSPEFFDALMRTSPPLKELFSFETRQLKKCKTCKTALNTSAPIEPVTKLNLYSEDQIFSTKQLLKTSRHVPSIIPCQKCHPGINRPEINWADTNEVFISVPEILMLSVNSWEIFPPYMKKMQVVKPTPKLWIGDKVYILRSVVQHLGASKGKYSRFLANYFSRKKKVFTILLTYDPLKKIAGNGHYTAVLQHPTSNTYTITDDTMVYTQSEDFNIKHAYCLFYERLEEVPSNSSHSLPSVSQMFTIQNLINSLEHEMVLEPEVDSDGDVGVSVSQPDIPFTNFRRAPIPDPSEEIRKKIQEMSAKDGESAEDAHERFRQIINDLEINELAEYVWATNVEAHQELAPIEPKDAKTRENIEKLKEIHRDGLKQLNLGKSNIQNLNTENPFIAAAYDFEDALAKKFEEPEICTICQESSYDSKIGLRTRKCARCADEFRGAKLEGVNPKTFSKENKMIPCEIPEELKDLSFAESKIIALANPLLHIYARKGLSSLRGNCIGT